MVTIHQAEASQVMVVIPSPTEATSHMVEITISPATINTNLNLSHMNTDHQAIQSLQAV